MAGPTSAGRGQMAPVVGRVAGEPAATVAGLGEFLKLQTVRVSLGAQQPSAAFRQNIAARFQQLFRLDLAALTLTNRGLLKK